MNVAGLVCASTPIRHRKRSGQSNGGASPTLRLVSTCTRKPSNAMTQASPKGLTPAVSHVRRQPTNLPSTMNNTPASESPEAVTSKGIGSSALLGFFESLADELHDQATIHNRAVLQHLSGWRNRKTRNAVLHSTAVCRALEASIRRALHNSPTHSK